MTKNPWRLRIGIAVVVLAMLARWVLRTLTSERPILVGPMLAGAVATAIIVVLVIVALRRRSAQQCRAVQAVRPDAELAAGWADTSLSSQLAALGVDESFRPGGGTHVVLSWDGHGLELWRDLRTPRVVHRLAWHQVAAVTVGEGIAGAAPRPAVCLQTVEGPQLVMVPTKAVHGGLLPARVDQAQALVDALAAQVSAARAR